MKKYKLIKEYPGSLELGAIVKQSHRGIYYFGVERLLEKEVEDFPEFWEEVIEKTYEVLVWHQKETGAFIDKRNDTILYKEEYMNNGEWYNIHSVKRLSDGEIFTVGDKVQCFSGFGHPCPPFTIKHLRIECNTVLTNGNRSINELSKCRQFLFKTKDSIDIYYGDECWGIRHDFSIYQINTKNDLTHIHTLSFSTKEAAQEYADWNKPKYSLEDIRTAYNTGRKNSFHTRKLETVIKNLKQIK